MENPQESLASVNGVMNNLQLSDGSLKRHASKAPSELRFIKF